MRCKTAYGHDLLTRLAQPQRLTTVLFDDLEARGQESVKANDQFLLTSKQVGHTADDNWRINATKQQKSTLKV